MKPHRHRDMQKTFKRFSQPFKAIFSHSSHSSTFSAASFYLLYMRNLFIVFLIILATNANACTTFCIGSLFGKNYDWSIGNGFLIVNPANLEKSSVSKHPAHWTSKFGSITFNQYGREFPHGGMNQAGLV